MNKQEKKKKATEEQSSLARLHCAVSRSLSMAAAPPLASGLW